MSPEYNKFDMLIYILKILKKNSKTLYNIIMLYTFNILLPLFYHFTEQKDNKVYYPSFKFSFK